MHNRPSRGEIWEISTGETVMVITNNHWNHHTRMQDLIAIPVRHLLNYNPKELVRYEVPVKAPFGGYLVAIASLLKTIPFEDLTTYVASASPLAISKLLNPYLQSMLLIDPANALSVGVQSWKVYMADPKPSLVEDKPVIVISSKQFEQDYSLKHLITLRLTSKRLENVRNYESLINLDRNKALGHSLSTLPSNRIFFNRPLNPNLVMTLKPEEKAIIATHLKSILGI